MAEGGPIENDEDDTWENIAELNEKHLRNIAKFIGNEWEQIATYLNITNVDVAKIKTDHAGNANEQIFQMLMRWKQQAQGSNLIEDLQAALRKVERRDLVKKIVKGCRKTPQFDVILCSEHVGNIKQYYCETCQRMVCKDCIPTSHQQPKHVTYDIREISVRYRQKLGDGIKLMDTERQATERALQELDKTEQGFNHNVDLALEKVKETVATLIKEVETKGRKKKAEIESLRATRSQSFNEERAELQDQKRRQSEKIAEAKRVTDIQPNSSFLLQGPAVLERFTKPVSEPPATSKTRVQLSVPRFLVGSSVGGIVVGNMVMKDTWKQVHIIGQKGSGVREFEGARGIAAAKPDKLAVTDRTNSRVVIIDSQGNNWKSMAIIANDVTTVPKRWVVSHPNVVKLYNRENAEYVSEFKTVSEGEEPREVNLIALAVTRDGHILVGDDQKVLTEHSPDGSILHTIPVKIKPFFLAAMVEKRSDDQLVQLIAISDLAQPSVHVIEISDADVATTVRRIHPVLDGQPSKDCRGVCANDSGVYIVATTQSYNEGHVHHYDPRGRFVTCVAKGLYNPYGITFTADEQRLAVADCQSVKIYQKM